MKKIILSLFLFITLINLPATLSCDDLTYSVSYLGKDDAGCFMGLEFRIYRTDCDASCFKEFNIITFQTNADYYRSFNVTKYSAQISNPFIVMIPSLNCTADKPTYEFFADLYGDRNCSLTFRLESEYQTYLTNLALEQANLAEQQRLEEERQKRLAEEEQKLLEEAKQYESNLITQTPELDLINNNSMLSTEINSTLTSDSENVTIREQRQEDIILNDEQINGLNQKEVENKKKLTLKLIIIGLITIIVLSTILIVLVVMKRPKKKVKKRKRR